MAISPASSLAFTLLLLIFPFNISCAREGGCSVKDIRIYQSPSSYTSLHVPKSTVQIVNEAWQRDAVYNVTVSCKDFASTTLINPLTFRRISLGSCLVKDGKEISLGEVISFQYSNLRPYEFTVLDLKC